MLFRDSYPGIEDYGLIGAMYTCGLISRSGSLDWFCLPAFDSPAVFSRLLDWCKGGYFQILPRGTTSVSRRYVSETNILETTFETETGVAVLTDFMPVYTMHTPRMDDGSPFQLPGDVELIVSTEDHHVPPLDEMLKPLHARYHQRVVRKLECTRGTITFDLTCKPRFDYGLVAPHTALVNPSRGKSNHAFARGGGNAISVYCSQPMTEAARAFHVSGKLTDGEAMYSAVTHQPFSLPVAEELDADSIEYLLKHTHDFWTDWASQCTYQGEHRDAVVRSALALKALTYEPSGGIVAAPTTSLPEAPGGVRNWDYRFTWIRDATFSLEALNGLGYEQEARAFKRWIEWTAAHPEDLQIMYGLRGERWLNEVELPLEGYKWSAPVRVGNGAHDQFQLDIYGEIVNSAYIYRKVVVAGDTHPDYWEFISDVIDYVITIWREPDAGIWETRGGWRHFVYSKAMCWVALDRGVKMAEEISADVDAPEAWGITPERIDRWREVRDEIRHDVLTNGYDPNYKDGRGAFVQHYGSKTLDASVLMLPLVGFIEATDPRMESTIRAIQDDLTSPQGFVYRYQGFDDGLSGGEGTFTICTFWLVSNLIKLGDHDAARRLFDMVRSYANDLGLFSEEIDANSGGMLGNFPQAFSHLAFVENAIELERAELPAGKEA